MHGNERVAPFLGQGISLTLTSLIIILNIVVSLSRSLRECMRERYRVTLVCLFGLASTTHINVLTIVVIAQVGA